MWFLMRILVATCGTMVLFERMLFGGASPPSQASQALDARQGFRVGLADKNSERIRELERRSNTASSRFKLHPLVLGRIHFKQSKALSPNDAATEPSSMIISLRKLREPSTSLLANLTKTKPRTFAALQTRPSFFS